MTRHYQTVTIENPRPGRYIIRHQDGRQVELYSRQAAHGLARRWDAEAVR